MQESQKQFSIIEIKPELENSQEIKVKVKNKEETEHGVKTLPENQRLINIEPEFQCHRDINQESQQEIHENETMPVVYKPIEIIPDQERLEILESFQKIEVETKVKCETKVESADDLTELCKHQTNAEPANVQTAYKQQTQADLAEAQNEYKQSTNTELGEVMTGICEITAKTENIVTKTEAEEVQSKYIQSKDTEQAIHRSGAESDNVRLRRLVQEVDELVQDCDSLLPANDKKNDNLCSKVAINLFFMKNIKKYFGSCYRLKDVPVMSSWCCFLL